MLPLAGLSRRAFVVAGALAAIAPTATAARRRKPAPEAFLAIAIQGVTIANGAFLWSYQPQVQHAASGFTKDLSGTTTSIAFTASQDQARQQIISGARSLAKIFLAQTGHEVAEDRIAVVLL